MTVKLTTLTSIAILVSMLLGQDDYTVGYNTKNLQEGENRIEINFRTVKRPFPTLGDVLEFCPPENLVGDEVTFRLDGKIQRYAVARLEGTNHVLKVKSDGLPAESSFHSIPWLPMIWITHKSNKPLGITVKGTVAGEYARIERRASREANRPALQPDIKVTIVGTNDVARPMHVKLKGGHIRLKGD